MTRMKNLAGLPLMVANAPVTPQPQVAKPTAALGNNVNTYA